MKTNSKFTLLAVALCAFVALGSGIVYFSSGLDPRSLKSDATGPSWSITVGNNTITVTDGVWCDTAWNVIGKIDANGHHTMNDGTSGFMQNVSNATVTTNGQTYTMDANPTVLGWYLKYLWRCADKAGMTFWEWELGSNPTPDKTNQTYLSFKAGFESDATTVVNSSASTTSQITIAPSAVTATTVQRVTNITDGIKAKGSGLNTNQKKILFLENVIKGLKELAAKPKYSSNPDVQAIVTNICAKLEQEITTLR